MDNELSELFDFILKLLKEYGIWGVIILLGIIVIQDPDRIIKLKSIFWGGTFRLFKLGTRKYIGTSISYRLNKFFNDDHLNKAFGSSNLRFEVKWVKRIDDPILKQNGTIILNLENTNDQTRNILNATQLSLPLILCSSLRSSINKDYQDAIDLTILKKMTDQIGKFAYPVFEKYFLEPGTEGKMELFELHKKLVRIDTYGIFSPIFIEEINILSSKFYAEAIREDISEDIKDLILYLLSIAERNIGEEIELSYIRKYFKLGFILVAKKAKALSEGASPYVERVGKDFRYSCDKVYLIGFASNTSFYHDLHDLLNSDKRYNVSDVQKVKSLNKDGIIEFIEILSIEKNTDNSDDKFKELVEYHELKNGDTVKCQLLDLMPDLAIFDVYGLTGYLYSKYCSWSRQTKCSDLFFKG